MSRPKWNRRPKRDLDKTKDIEVPFNILSKDEYKISRVKPKRKKRKHQGFTTVPEHRLWIFENNKYNGVKNG